jgi:hypothetical protein
VCPQGGVGPDSDLPSGAVYPRGVTSEDIRGLVGRLEGEVNNGGFDQFFFNSAGDRAADSIEALEAIGAHKTADIVRRACARFPGGMPPADRFARQEVLEIVSPDSEAFEDEDQAFLAYEEDLASLVASHVDRR